MLEIINMKNHEEHNSSRVEVLLEELINEVGAHRESLDSRMKSDRYESLTDNENLALAKELISEIKKFARIQSTLCDIKSMLTIKE